MQIQNTGTHLSYVTIYLIKTARLGLHLKESWHFCLSQGPRVGLRQTIG